MDSGVQRSSANPFNGENMTPMSGAGVGVDDCHIFISPGSIKYWVPVCDDSLTPYVGQEFKDLEAAFHFYEAYATKVRFVIRRSTTKNLKGGGLKEKHLVCNYEGFRFGVPRGGKTPRVHQDNSSKAKQRRVSNRVGCMARLVLKNAEGGSLYVSAFVDRHNHNMYSPLSLPFRKSNRKMQSVHKHFVASCARANIGPSRSHRLYKEMVNGYDNVGATSTDFNNFTRDLHAFTRGRDAQLLIDNFTEKHKMCYAFYFRKEVDKLDHLSRFFWADPIARKNYALFEDVVSFDATYRTNRYNLVFVPFTSVSPLQLDY